MTETLKSAYPDMLVANRFIDDALHRLDAVDQFTAMVARIDQVHSNEKEQTDTEINKEILGVTEVLNTVCQIEKAVWG